MDNSGVMDISEEQYPRGKEIVVTFLAGNENRKYKCFENDLTYNIKEIK